MAKIKKPEPEAVPQVEPAAPQARGVRIITQYIRDMSFENPRAPESLRVEAVPPKMELQVELNAQSRPDGFYVVELKLVASANREQEVVFHAEVIYCGLFAIDGLEPDEIEPALLVECPRFLFPFARQVISTITGDGGFPPFRVDPIDFAGIYVARQGQIQRGEGGNA